MVGELVLSKIFTSFLILFGSSAKTKLYPPAQFKVLFSFHECFPKIWFTNRVVCLKFWSLTKAPSSCGSWSKTYPNPFLPCSYKLSSDLFTKRVLYLILWVSFNLIPTLIYPVVFVLVIKLSTSFEAAVTPFERLTGLETAGNALSNTFDLNALNTPSWCSNDLEWEPMKKTETSFSKISNFLAAEKEPL